MSAPLVSVVIPVYNGEATILETVSSVCQQSYQHFELLVIDDGSKDRTRELIASVNDARVRLLSYENRGLSASRNRGIAAAKGEYVTFIDADDLWSTDKVASQLAALQAVPSAGVAYSWTQFIDTHGKPTYLGMRANQSGNVYAALLEANFLESGSNAMMRRDVFDQVGLFDESMLLGGEDRDFFIRAAKHCEFVCVPREQIFYRVSVTSMSANVRKQEQGSIPVLDRAFAQAPPELQHLRGRAKARTYEFLASRALNNARSRADSWLAFNYYLRALWFHLPQVRRPFFLQGMVKAAAMSVLSTRFVSAAMNQMKQLAGRAA